MITAYWKLQVLKNLEYSEIKFDDSDDIFTVGDVWTLESQTGSSQKAREKELEDIDIPKFNLFQRAVNATNLTRKTIIEILRKCDEKVQMGFLDLIRGSLGRGHRRRRSEVAVSSVVETTSLDSGRDFFYNLRMSTL